MPDKISEIMIPDPVCCLTNDMLQRVAQILRDEDVGSLPVISDPVRKGLIGIITDRDIVVRAVADGLDVKATRVAEVMSTNTVT